jgi:pyrrolidone-carboxylate peptidase
MNSEILVIGFEPFGLRRKNTSQEICNFCPGVLTRVLPVNLFALDILKDDLEIFNPKLVILLGEDLGLIGARIEPCAYRNQVVLYSNFVKELEGFEENFVKVKEKIGNYMCNDVYFEALRWANKEDNRKVVFIHVGAFFSLKIGLRLVSKIIKGVG